VTDAISPLRNEFSPWGIQVQDNVLGLAVSRANGLLLLELDLLFQSQVRCLRYQIWYDQGLDDSVLALRIKTIL
jgi:hypothetical protein